MQAEVTESPVERGGRRRAGVLLHVTSLPGSGPCGDLGQEAENFVDFLAAGGISVWQTLPVGPTGDDLSPYQSSSAHAGNPRLISLERLRDWGWIGADDMPEQGFADLDKKTALRCSWDRFRERATDEERGALERFEEDNDYWLEDYCLFSALRGELNSGWWFGDLVWEGTIDGEEVAVQVRPIVNGVHLTYQGVEVPVRVLTEREAVYLALTVDLDSYGGVFQIATSIETSVNQLVKLIEGATGSKLQIIYEAERKGEIRRNYSDITKARKQLGFEPKRELGEGLRELWGLRGA